MFEDDDYEAGEDELPTWLILPAVLMGLGILVAAGYALMILR